ncbi:MAG TPA: thioredoxin [Candidatus Tectomicrobia bacterium]|jgi:thioredoxin 1
MTTTHATQATFTETNFRHEVLENPQPVLVDFWAPWCGPCHVMAPVIDQLATEFAGRATVGKVNVDEQPALAQQYGIRSIPALLVFQHGHVVDKAIGITSKQVLSALLTEQFETA